MSQSFDPIEDDDDFQNDPDTKSVLVMIDAVISKRAAQESYDWICDLENKIQDRADALAANPKVKG